MLIARLALEAAALFLMATFVFDTIHYALHQCLQSRWRWLRHLASPHQAHHDFFDCRLQHHEAAVVPNLLLHVIPEYACQMVICAAASAVFDPLPVAAVAALFSVLFLAVMIVRGKDRNHEMSDILPAAHETLFVRAPYHALHHIYSDCYMSSYTTLFDRLMGTACQIRGRRFAVTGTSGSLGSALKELLERSGAVVVPLKFGVDYTYDDYSGADPSLQTADVLILAHGAKGDQAMAANCDSFLSLIERFKTLTRDRQVPIEVWAVGSEIECHPAWGIPELQAYARSKRAYARAAASLVHDRGLLYRHIVPAAFSSRMGPGLVGGRTTALVALWLIRRGFRYVPVTYTGIAFLNFLPFFVRALLTRSSPSCRAHSMPVDSPLATAEAIPAFPLQDFGSARLRLGHRRAM